MCSLYTLLRPGTYPEQSRWPTSIQAVAEMRTHRSHCISWQVKPDHEGWCRSKDWWEWPGLSSGCRHLGFLLRYKQIVQRRGVFISAGCSELGSFETLRKENRGDLVMILIYKMDWWGWFVIQVIEIFMLVKQRKCVISNCRRHWVGTSFRIFEFSSPTFFVSLPSTTLTLS